MPEMDGLAVLKELNAKKMDVPIILMTAHNSANIAIQATQLGAYDYITKPFELDEVLLTINRYFERQQLTSEVRSLRSQLGQRDPSERIIGNSPAMQDVYKMIGRAAGTDATVLITGETGTGKELVAQVIHYQLAVPPRPAGQGQLRRAAGNAAGKRTVRPREGRLHRRA